MSAALPWKEVLSLLEIASPDHALPAAVQCPLCRRHNALILADVVQGGQWYWCGDCRFGGDLIELCGAVWKLDLSLAAAKLSESGLTWESAQPPDATQIETYVNETKRRRRRTDFIQQARKDALLQRNTALGKLCGKLRLRLEDQSGPRWKQGVGELLLGSTYESAERAFHDWRPKTPNARTNRSVDRIFRGPKWNEVLALPFYDLPGRPCGFQFIGRKGDPEQDFAWKFTWIESEKRREAGVCFHPGVPALPEADEGVLCCPDALLMLRLQLAQFRRSYSPLPLIAWHHSKVGRTQHGWAWWRQPLVFWDVALTPETLLQAVEQDARITLAGSRDPAKMSAILLRDPPATFCKRLLRNALPWQRAWSEFVAEAPLRDLEHVFLGYRLLGGALEPLATVLARRERERLEHLLKGALERRVSFDGRTILETHNGWSEEAGSGRAKRKLVLNAVLRIDSIIQLKQPPRSYYAGRVLFQGREYPFTAPGKSLDNNGFAWLAEFLDSVQAVEPLQGDTSYNRKLVRVARQFQPAKFVEGVNRVGWETGADRFRLPKFSLAVGGEIQPEFHDVLPETLPAAELPSPDALAPSDVQTLTAGSPSLEMFWAAATALAANVLAPAFGRSSLGLAISGAGAATMGQQTAIAFGCPLSTVPLEKTAEAEERHAWPLLVPPKSWRQIAVLNYLVDRPDDRWGVCVMDWIKALASQLTGGWRVLDADEPAPTPTTFRESAGKLISAYLHDVCLRRLRLRSESAIWIEMVRDDLAAFVAERSGSAAAVLASARWLRSEAPESLQDSLGDLLAHWTLSGKLVAEPAEFADRIQRFTLLKLPEEEGRPEGVFLFRSVLNYLLDNHKAPPLEPERLTEILAPVLIEEGTYSDQPGWLIRAEWWVSAVHRRRAARAKLLNVVG